MCIEPLLKNYNKKNLEPMYNNYEAGFILSNDKNNKILLCDWQYELHIKPYVIRTKHK